MTTHPEAFVLVHIHEVTLSTARASESGTLALECVTLAPDNADRNAPLAASLAASDRSLILVLRLNSLELPLDPARSISLHISRDGTRTYTFHSDTPGAPVDQEPSYIRLTVPVPSKPDPHRAETVEALDHIFGQYAEFDWGTEGSEHQHAPSPDAAGGATQEGQPAEDLRGRLVLMDETNGEIVGELPNRVHINEDPTLAQEVKGKDGELPPVMLELPPDVYDAYTGAGTSVVPFVEPTSELDEARAIFVRAIPPEDQDWVTKSATLVSHAISSSTSLLLNGLTYASNYYINHSTPGSQTPSGSKDGTSSPPPSRALLLLSHPRTQQTLSRAYTISGQAVKVSQKTVSIVEDLINRAVGNDKAKAKAASASVTSQPRLQPSAASSSTGVGSSPTTVSDAPPPPYPGTGLPTQDNKPPLSPRKGDGPAANPPPLPPRGKSSSTSAGGEKSPPSPVSSSPASAGGSTPAPKPVRARTRDKMLLSANLVLTTVDDSLRRTFDVGSERVTAVVGHKFGPDAARSTHLATHTARNVTLVYIDMRGFARRALIKKAGKNWVKARFGGDKEMSGLVVDKQEPVEQSK